MAKVVVNDLNGKAVELQPGPEQILVFFTNQDIKLLESIAAELPSQDRTMELIGVYLGSDAGAVTSVQRSNPSLQMYKASNITAYQHLDVEDLPWIVHMQSGSVKKSVNLSGLASPILSNLFKNQARKPAKREPTRKSAKEITKKPPEPTTAERVQRIERQADLNRQEIEFMRQEIAKRDEQINDLLEKL